MKENEKQKECQKECKKECQKECQKERGTILVRSRAYTKSNAMALLA